MPMLPAVSEVTSKSSDFSYSGNKNKLLPFHFSNCAAKINGYQRAAQGQHKVGLANAFPKIFVFNAHEKQSSKAIP